MKRLLFLPLFPLLLLLCASTTQQQDRDLTLVAHIHEIDSPSPAASTQIGIVSSGTGFHVVGPVTGWGPWGGTSESTTGPVQELETEWISGGLTHRVKTKIGRGTDGMRIAVGRHERLVTLQLAAWPRDP